MPTKPKKTSRFASAPRRKSRAKKTARGDCYEAAAGYILSVVERSGAPEAAANLRVVHAEVMGQGPLEGTTFGHGFVVDVAADMVIDKSNGRDLHLPRVIYYAIGQINDIDNIYEYTYEEVAANMVESGHYGPWDLKTSSGL